MRLGTTKGVAADAIPPGLSASESILWQCTRCVVQSVVRVLLHVVRSPCARMVSTMTNTLAGISEKNYFDDLFVRALASMPVAIAVENSSDSTATGSRRRPRS